MLLPIPFTDLTSSKVRPAIVVGHGSFPGDLFVVPITSQLGNADFLLTEWRTAGLNVASGVKGQISTVEDRLVRKTVGSAVPLSMERRVRFCLRKGEFDGSFSARHGARA